MGWAHHVWPFALWGVLLLASGSSRADSDPALFERPWVWKDEHGQTVSLSKWKGAPLVVSVFYARCQLRCPRTLDKLRELEAAYRRAGQRANFVLVTLDPRAEAADLSDFKRARHLPDDTWHLLSGDENRTRALCRLLGVHPAYDDDHVDHEVRIAIFDASGAMVRRLEGWDFDGEGAIR